jgi:hypothetical protein
MNAKLYLLTTLALSAQAMADKPPAYHEMTVNDFVIDSPKLVASHARVAIHGQYVKEGSVDMLYTDMRAVIMTQYGAQARIPLFSDSATRALRAKMLECASNPGTFKYGCQISIKGRAVDCSLSNAFGANHHDACIDLDDLAETAASMPPQRAPAQSANTNEPLLGPVVLPNVPTATPAPPLPRAPTHDEIAQRCIANLTATGKYSDPQGAAYMRAACSSMAK